jgi:hypothetical protein
MLTIFDMMSLKFTRISFPTKVIPINKWNGSISLIWWYMFKVSIKSLRVMILPLINHWFRLDLRFRKRLCLKLGINLQKVWILSLVNFSKNFILTGDYCYFNCIRVCFYRNCFFHIIMCFLFSIKTLDIVLRHWVSFIGDLWHVLNKSYHCFIAMRIKFSIITCMQILKFIRTIFRGIFWYFRFNCILKVW